MDGGEKDSLSLLFHCRIAFRKVIEHRLAIDCLMQAHTRLQLEAPSVHALIQYSIISFFRQT